VYLYIDETETDDYFVVCGLLMSSKEVTELAFSNFKNSIKNYYIPNNYKTSIYKEFKSTLTDNRYRVIKKRMLEFINHYAVVIVCCTYKKENKALKQSIKEKLYIKCLKEITKTLVKYKDIHILFDRFGKKSFEEAVSSKFLENTNIVSAIPIDSCVNHGIQFVDNVCGAMRLFLSKKEKRYYNALKNKTIFINI